MINNPNKKEFLLAALIAILLPFGVYLLWTTTNFVIAYQEKKQVHVFPKEVRGEGWNAIENAQIQDLPASAGLGSFSRQNSAYIELAASTSTDVENEIRLPVSPPPPPSEVLPTSTATSVQETMTVSPPPPEPATTTPQFDLPLPVIVSTSTPLLIPETEPESPATSTLPMEEVIPPTPVVTPPPPPVVEPTVSESVPDADNPPAATSSPELPVPVEEEITSTSSATTTSALNRLVPKVFESLANFGGFLFSQIAETAFATTTSASTPATTTESDAPTFPDMRTAEELASSTASSTMPEDPIDITGEAAITPISHDDIATCSTLETDCHILEFAGFGVSGSLTEKTFQGARINFSFANISPETDLREGKFEVRYYHAGKWRTGGEIYLNKEISNSTNGSYFSTRLEGINTWKDLSDLRVIVEYTRGDDHVESKLYLDALWVETSYKDPIQDVLAGDTGNITDTPENIRTGLTQGSAMESMLITDEGAQIELPYLSSLTNNLLIRVDKSLYKVDKEKSPTTVFASVTNTSRTDGSFRVYGGFPGGQGNALSVSRYMRDVPIATTTPIYHDVTYFCEAGWNRATSTEGYECSGIPEKYLCSAVSEENKNCLVSNVQVGVATSTNFISTWVDAKLSEVVDRDEEVMGELPRGYSITVSTEDEFEIPAGRTVFLKIVLDSPDTSARKFVLYAKGGGLFGSADSLRMKNEESWKLQNAAAKGREREHVNEQVSTKSDFSVDEMPSFRFKFKTQRAFFTRVMDYISRNKVDYAVKSAKLIRNNGEAENVPIHIGYTQDGEWELQLEKPPRSFRPGKYTLELQMDEGGQTYTDTVEFYWGVLVVNSNKSVYGLDEKVTFTMASLTDDGDTQCDAQLELHIADPSGASTDVPVVSGGGCGFNNVTDLPDYVGEYTTSITGQYTVTLSYLNSEGAIINSTTDTFTAEVDPPYSVERIGPTRIYPVSTYQMHITFNPRNDFSGTFKEVVPEGFGIPVSNGGTVTRENGAISITWPTDLLAGETRTFTYTFKAPEISPYLYILGPQQLINNSGETVFTEGRTWKIASDALSIATGVAWLNGTTTTNGTDWMNTTAAAINWTTNDYDDAYYTHSTTTSNTQVTINVAGDYLVALTVPTIRTDGSNTISAIETDIRVNGVKVNQGVGRSSSQRSTVPESSSHLTFLLHNLQIGDYVEAYARANITSVAGLDAIADPQASMYIEYIPSSETIFTATATTTTFGTNLNGTATTALMWFTDTSDRVDTGYAHVNGPATSSSQITLASAGDYLVAINIPLSATTANLRPRGRILLNGTMASSSDFAQGFISNSNGHTSASYHWYGVVHSTTTNVNMTVTTKQAEVSAAGTATVSGDVASIYIQKLPSSELYVGEATTTSTGTSFNPAATSSVLWQFDNHKDTNNYSHSTSSNPSTITIQKAGDYFLTYNDALTGTTARTSPRVSVSVNGTVVPGSYVTSHFIRDTGGTDQESSGSLTFLLRNLAVNDQVTVRSVAQGVTGAMTLRQRAQLMLWRKAAQSNWIQDTWAWYQNIDNQTPTTRWTNTATDTEAITSGNSIKSGNAIRLRMALQANTNTVAGDDTFKLQYAAGETCSAALTWTDVGATGSGEIWRAHDNASVSGGSTLATSLLLSGNAVLQTYEESNPTAVTPNGASIGQDAEWDWSIQDNGAPAGTGYCFRMVQSTGQLLKNYNDGSYPQLVTNSTPETPTLFTMFDNEKTASTSPWFTFQASDDNGEGVDYQIQVSTDPAFASTVIDENSVSNLNDFENIETPSDKSPFNSGETVRYIDNAAALTNGTTYYWRVRSIDTSGTNTYSSWSTTYSFTVDTSVTVSTWFQTTTTQFNVGTLSNVEATSSAQVGLIAGQSSGTIWSPAIAYSSHVSGNSWGNFSWSDAQPGANTIRYQLEYFTSTSSWALIPATDLTSVNPSFNNAAGTTTGPINLSGLDTDTYSIIRLKATFTRITGTPLLRDWTMAWSLSVARPTLVALFDNEKTSTTTPSLQFYSSDPQGDKLTYQVQWSTDSTFATVNGSSTSDFGSATTYGWSNISSTTAAQQTSPFTSGHTVQFTISTTTPLTNGSTYWWRVRAKDTLSTNAYSLWSTERSFTVDTTVDRSTWFQTTSAQFATDDLARTTATNNTISGFTDTGKIAIYRAAAAGESITPSVTINHRFDTTVRQDDIYAMQFGSSSIVLDAGYYAVLYGFRADSPGASRTMMRSNLSLASTTLPIGWSSGMIRGATGALEGFNSGGGIIKVTSDNSALVLQTRRSDTNPTVTQTRTANTAGIQLIRLDSSWPYLRLSKTGTQVGPTSANWVTVTYNRQDEIDTTYYGHTSGSGSITLYRTGHYIIFANTYGAETTGTNTLNQKLVLNGSDIRGSYASLHHIATNGILEGALSSGIIIEVTSPTSTLAVQLNHSVGTNPWTINAASTSTYVDRTAITIVKIPDGDFIRLSTTTPSVMNPTALTTNWWGVEDEKDTGSFSHTNTGANASRVQVLIAGDYLALANLYASSTLQATTQYQHGWLKNGAGGLIQYGQTGGFLNAAGAGNAVGNWTGTIFPGLVNGDYFESVTQTLGTNVGGVRSSSAELEAVRIGSLSEADPVAQTVDSTDITFSDGNGPRWGAISWSDTTPGTTDIKYQLYYYASTTGSYREVPNFVLQGMNPQFDNGSSTTGTSTGPIDITGIDRTVYSTLRLRANFECAGGQCPTLNDWTLTWHPGVTVSGTAKQYDQSTNVTSGTVRVAVNGVLQTKTGIISGGTWSIAGVNATQGDVITTWITNAADANEAVGVTIASSTSNVTGMSLFEGHVSLGSDDNPTISNNDLALYDYSTSNNNEDIFYDVDAANDLALCPFGISGCFKNRLLIKANTTYRPDSASSGNVSVRNIQIDGTLVADGNTFFIRGSWKNNYVFTKNSSTVIFTATSTAETVDSSSATSSAAFNIVTFGQTSGTTTWTLSNRFGASSTLSVNFGTLVQGANPINLDGDLNIGASGIFAKGSASTTFMGTGSSSWTDSSSAKQDMGTVVIDGSSKTVTLASSVMATNVTIGADDTLNAGGANTISVVGHWTNNNVFTAQTGTVSFIATTTGRVITPGTSSFYNLTFNGGNGNWAFTTNTATTTNDFTIATGTVTLPTGTTTVGGSWNSLSGVFQHNNGAVLFNATASGKTIRFATTTPFYNIAFNGSGGGWTFTDLNATTSRSMTIQAGTVTMPAGVFAIGASLNNTGGTITANNGTLKFTATSANTIRLNGSSAYNMTFNGIGGSWTFADANATSTNNFRLEHGTTTMPSGSLGIGGSFLNVNNPSSGFVHNNGIVRLTSTASGNTVLATGSNFYDLVFNGVGGSWTISGSATSTRNTAFTQANSITLSSGRTLEVGGTFTNLLSNASTTWTGAALYLNSGTTYAINTKGPSGDTYNQLTLGTNTNIASWNSSVSSIFTPSSTSFYSQNNASSSGSLYIYGNFATSSNIYWDYSRDFDGITLTGGAQRQVNVKIASSSIVTLTGSTSIQGFSTATTTIANQGSGFFSFNIAGGTTTARYYSFASTTPLGVLITGSNTVISSLDNGSFNLDTPSGGTSISVMGSAMDKNPELQILYARFSTSTGVINGYNVTATSSPIDSAGNYWWFKNGYGPFYGESYDNDSGPGTAGNPGWAQFDDSGITVNIQGRVFADHYGTVIGGGVCNGSTPVVVIRTSGGLSYSGPCDGSGAFNIAATFTTSNVLTVYLNTNGGARAATITKNVTGTISNLDLYQNAVIVRQFDSTPTTIDDMTYTDSTIDTDIPFTATSSLMVEPNTELYVWTGKSFAPGGDVILQSGGSGSVTDGRLYLATSSTFTLSGTPNISIGGSLQIDTGSTFTTSNANFVFNATTSGKSIFATRPIVFGNVEFNGTGGSWSINGTSTATTTIRALTLTAGTLTGPGDVDIQSGGVTGGGTINMTGGLFLVEGTGNFGNSNQWTFNNLTFGTSTANTITKTAGATTTVTGVLRIAANQTLNAGSTAADTWVLSGGGTPFLISGTFNALGVPFVYSGSTATNITAATYGPLYLTPSSGTPTYTLLSGNLTPYHFVIGNGTNNLTVSGTTNDPNINVTGDFIIRSNATFVAPDAINANFKGSWTNSGIYTPSSRIVIFDATTTGKTINPGNSSFYDVQFNSTNGGWTVSGNATTTRNFTLSSASNFTLSSGRSFEVNGTFSNSVASSSQTWTGSVLYLNSGTSYNINTKSAGNATYGQLTIGANTKLRSWNSAANSTSVHSSGSLYAQNYASSSGQLYIWGSYTHSSGSDYWDYATDFDGVDLSATPRKVNVYVASSSSMTFSGGLLDIIGAPTASTTIQVQGTGAYTWNVSGGSLNAQYYEVRNTDPSGLNISGYPTITGLNNGDFLIASSSNTAITIDGTVLSVNPLKVIRYVKFATTSTAVTAFNVTAQNATSSYWKFNLGYGNIYGEQYDNDSGGDPGYVRFDNSNDHISVSGTMYSDEGVTPSSGCDGVTQLVQLKVAGAGSFTTSCAAGTGAYTFPDVGFNPGDVLSLYIASSSKRSATITRGPTGNIADLDLYEHRVILRHEDPTPLTIADMDWYDSAQDSNIPFLVTISATNTAIVEANTKVIVWTGKTFVPAGELTVQSGGVGGSVDGTLELYANSTFTAAGTQIHSVGGSFLVGSGATFSPANSTVTFTATTTGKTITPQNSNFYNVTFNGVGGNWAFSAAATSTNAFTISTGTVTLPTTSLEVGGSFLNTGGTFQHNNGLVRVISTASGNSIRTNNSPFYDFTASGSGGAWSFDDSSATSSNDFTISAGAVTAPPVTLAVGGSFINSATFTANSGTVRLTAASAKSLRAGNSNFYNLRFDGPGGGWTFLDLNATTSRDFIIATGTVTMASGTVAVGGNFTAASSFNSNAGTVKFVATTTGFTVNVASSTFFQLWFDASAGGWTITSNATSTATTTLSRASSFTLQSGKSLEVQGGFTNAISSATTWTGSILYLNSGMSYSINSKTDPNETYGQLTLGTNTNIRSWNSSAATTTAGTAASLYSQNNGGTSGSLYIYGTYTKSNDTDYWSAATDFDGVALGGLARRVNVRIATSSSVSYTGGSLSMIGTSTATTTVFASGTTEYGFSFAGGTLNAQYYQFKNMDQNGVVISGLPTITSLSYGDFELSAASGTAISLAASVVDSNANLVITSVRFASTTANLRGFNVMLTSTPGSFWTFTGAYGNIAGESFDADGATLCGRLRWDDSDCQFLNQAHYRWRNDDGGEGAQSSDWYDTSFTKRQRVSIANANATTYTNLPVKIVVQYDADMQGDFDDLRFTDSSGTTSISYWRESQVNSASSTVWVEVPSLTSGGSAVVYMYYGSSTASTADSGSNVFSFFEDWEDNIITDYSGDNIAPNFFQTTTGFNHPGSLGSYALVGNGTAGATPNGLYKTGSQTAQGKTISWWQYVDKTAGDGTDEPCTLFGVQTPAGLPVTNDYAVCLDEFSNATLNKRVSIARDTHSRDVAGYVMASTTVTYSDAWYEVVVDWLTTNVINVNVYTAGGGLFATVSTTTSLYSSGGIGFSSFTQHGAWDDVKVKQYTASAPTYGFGSEQTSDGATWKAAEDTPITALLPNQNVRLRFSLQNTGTAVTNHTYRLQYAPKGGALNCGSVASVDYNDVPASSSGCGAHAACMKTSSYFTDGASTSPALSFSGSLAWTAGYMIEDPSYQTNPMNVGHDVATETEYNFQITNSATESNYCFRVVNGATELANYDKVAEAGIAYPPYISEDFTINDGFNINLDEGTSTIIYATSTVTDNNGYADIVLATSTMYRSGVSNGAWCSADTNNCYQSPTSHCSLSNCSGNSCTMSCVAYMQYYTEPTDAGSTYSAQNWLATMAVEDASGYRDTQTSLGVELNTLRALDITTGDLDFGALEVGQNTGTTNATTTARNTGNVPIDIDISGTQMQGSTGYIATSSQIYATTTFAYGSCSICQFLSGTAAPANVSVSKPTSTTTAQTQDIYFGITIPSGSAAEAYSGVNTFTAVPPSP